MIDQYITGSNGFIGKHLLPKLTGETIAIPHQDIATYQLQDFHNFFFLSTYGNMSDHNDIVKIFKANVTDVLKTVRQIGNMRFEPDLFLFASSSSVNLPVQTAYSYTKAAAEHIIVSSGLPSCIVRPFSIIGKSEQPSHLIPTLIRSCLEGEAISFVGQPVHDYIDVADLVDALLYLADTKSRGVYEIGSGIPTTNLEVRKIVEEECGAEANVVITKWMREYDSLDWYCRESAWKPKKSLRESVAEIVADYRLFPTKYAKNLPSL